MSTDYHVEGIKPPDGRWKQMKKVYDACEKVGIDIPDEVSNFFDGEVPDDKGVVVSLNKSRCVSEVPEQGSHCYDVDLSKLSPDIKIVRFCISW